MQRREYRWSWSAAFSRMSLQSQKSIQRLVLSFHLGSNFDSRTYGLCPFFFLSLTYIAIIAAPITNPIHLLIHSLIPSFIPSLLLLTHNVNFFLANRILFVLISFNLDERTRTAIRAENHKSLGTFKRFRNCRKYAKRVRGVRNE